MAFGYTCILGGIFVEIFVLRGSVCSVSFDIESSSLISGFLDRPNRHYALSLMQLPTWCEIRKEWLSQQEVTSQLRSTTYFITLCAFSDIVKHFHT